MLSSSAQGVQQAQSAESDTLFALELTDEKADNERSRDQP